MACNLCRHCWEISSATRGTLRDCRVRSVSVERGKRKGMYFIKEIHKARRLQSLKVDQIRFFVVDLD